MPYTYLIKCVPTQQVYYGVRTKYKGTPEDDLWQNYFTSSRIVKDLIKKYGKESFIYEVRKVFDNELDAKLHEWEVLIRVKALHNWTWLNEAAVHPTTGEFSEKTVYRSPGTLPKKKIPKIQKPWTPGVDNSTIALQNVDRSTWKAPDSEFQKPPKRKTKKKKRVKHQQADPFSKRSIKKRAKDKRRGIGQAEKRKFQIAYTKRKNLGGIYP